MTTKQRVENIDDLKAHLFDLFGPEVEPWGTNHYQLMFFLEGKVKSAVADLQAKTGKENWDGGGANWFYQDTELNLTICLFGAPRCVMVIASVTSLHKEALERHAKELEHCRSELDAESATPPVPSA